MSSHGFIIEIQALKADKGYGLQDGSSIFSCHWEKLSSQWAIGRGELIDLFHSSRNNLAMIKINVRYVVWAFPDYLKLDSPVGPPKKRHSNNITESTKEKKRKRSQGVHDLPLFYYTYTVIETEKKQLISKGLNKMLTAIISAIA